MKLMNTYLLAWNPKRFDWDIQESILEISKNGFCKGRWSCGQLKKIKKGDRVFLIRLAKEPKGIVASGFALSDVFEDEHWAEENKKGLYIDINFDCILDVNENDILRLEYLSRLDFHWTIQAATTIPEDVAKKVEEYWSELSNVSAIFPNELIDDKIIYEGSITKVLVNKYERNPEARKICIEYYGHKCSVCNFDFEEVYGEIGKDFIHVHHIKPLSEVKENYIVNPVEDLIPICPNCHAMIHRRKKVLSKDELKNILMNPKIRESI
ncbi:MAG: HNH endonuclease [Leptospiraceae bacterium]|nr:HNH endonuclease [Leptospiraceae bacterium]